MHPQLLRFLRFLKNANKQHLLKQINEMLAMGMTQQEVADELGLTGYRPVHELLKRERRKKLLAFRSPKVDLVYGS